MDVSAFDHEPSQSTGCLLIAICCHLLRRSEVAKKMLFRQSSLSVIEAATLFCLSIQKQSHDKPRKPRDMEMAQPFIVPLYLVIPFVAYFKRQICLYTAQQTLHAVSSIRHPSS